MPRAPGEFCCGTIEGFYGDPWSWEARADHAKFLARAGFDFYVYAPKFDTRLRKRWREDWPEHEWSALVQLREQFRDAGVAFGIGLTPWGTQSHYDAETRAALRAKLARIDALAPDLLALLCDDMPGIVGDLARRQVEIARDARDASRADRMLFCPTYYSDDPVLERACGPMPERYLEELGKGLDPELGIFWTGTRICSREYGEAHLADVTARLGRRPFLWDNYPVNDGPRMCRYLHLRAVTGRPAGLREWTSGIAANPMSQPELSKIPLLSLQQSLASARGYDSAAAFRDCARKLCSAPLADALERDLAAFQDEGLGAIDAGRRAELRARYAAFDEPAAREVVAWLDGAFEPSQEVLAAFEGWDV